MPPKNQSADTGKMGMIRWQIPLVLLVSVLISYLDRMNISYALPMIAKDYGWGIEETGKYGGLLMSIFFVGYGFANIFLSPLGEKFGPRKSIMFIVVLFSLFTYLQSPFGMMLTAFIVMRLFLGFSEGIHFPMMNVLTKKWFPLHERSRGNGIWVCGMFLAMILAPLIVVPIIDNFGWQNMFVVLSFSGILVTIPLIYFFVYNKPEEHPRITPKEVEYIANGMELDEPDDKPFWQSLKWLSRQPTFWLAMIGGICNNIATFGMISWLPTYFTNGRGLEFSKLAYATSIPYIFSIAGVALWSYLGDKTNKRATTAGIGFFCASIGIYFAATAVSINAVIILFSLTILLNSAYVSNEFTIIQRIVPKQIIGSGTGIYNGFAMMIGGGIGPVLVGSIVASTGSYTSGILVLSVVLCIGGVTMLILGRLLKY